MSLSIVQVSLQNYRLTEYPSEEQQDGDGEDEADEVEQERRARTGINSGRGNGNGGSGKRGPKKPVKPAAAGEKKREIVTKHDLDKDALKNAKRMERVHPFRSWLFLCALSYPFASLSPLQLPGIAVGNPAKVKDLRLPYKVFNSLKNHAAKAAGREDARNKTRLFDKDDYSTQDSVLDKRTRILVTISQMFLPTSLFLFC